MKQFKKITLLTLLMTLIFSLSAVAASAAPAVNVAIDGSPLTISSSYGTPYVDASNRTMIPARAVFEKLGAKVTWDAASKTVVIDGNIKIKIGSSEITTPYGPIKMDTTAVVNKDNRTYIPFRFTGQALGYDVSWDDKTSTANVITKADLTVSAAASLKNALNEIQAMYLKERPNAKIAISYGGSGTLQQQIEQGAPVDVFVSAAASNMTTLKDKGLMVNSTIKNLLRNKVVLIVPSNSTLKIASFKDATGDSVKKLALGEPATVPAGKYAEQVFKFNGVLDAAKAKAVYAKDVTEVLNWVASGNADAGVVYSTDAKSSDKVKVVATAGADAHDPVVYPGGVVKATKQPVSSGYFLNYLTSPAAQAVFEKYGFAVI